MLMNVRTETPMPTKIRLKPISFGSQSLTLPSKRFQRLNTPRNAAGTEPNAIHFAISRLTFFCQWWSPAPNVFVTAA